MASTRHGLLRMAVFAIAILTLMFVSPAWTADKPNILFIMGDDIGWMQVGAYHEGIGIGETPNIDRIAHEGGRFMEYYAMQSCTSGRNGFLRACIRCGPA